MHLLPCKRPSRSGFTALESIVLLLVLAMLAVTTFAVYRKWQMMPRSASSDPHTVETKAE